MSTTRELLDDEIAQEYVDDDSETVKSRRYRLLRAEYEICRQQVHDLKRKHNLNEAMLREVQETNESLECTLDRLASEKEQILLSMEEKHRAISKEYDSVVSNLETKLRKQATEIEDLRQRVAQCNEETNCATTVNQSADITLETDNAALSKQVEHLLLLLQKEKEKCDRAGETIEQLKNQCTEYEHILRTVKEQLAEKSKSLEDARAELILKRAEAISLNTDPVHDFSKGNSLFAEVEDRRQNIVVKMNALREKYGQVKRICKTQATEIKALRTERAATLGKWENDSVHTLAESDELIRKYKNRISDLESKLKSEIKKNDDVHPSNPSDASFGYFQSLLDAKKKETDQFRVQIEDLSTQLLVQEETKTNIAKQLRYWRYKASSLEAQVLAANTELNVNEAQCQNESDDFLRDDGQGIGEAKSNGETSKHLTDGTIVRSQSDEGEQRAQRTEICGSEGSNRNEEKTTVPKKILRFAENTNTNTDRNSNSNLQQTAATQCKYTTVYIPTDS